MNIFRILLLLLLGLLGRRMYLAFKSSGQGGGTETSAGFSGPVHNSGKPSGKPMGDLTEQDISDADFEEIP